MNNKKKMEKFSSVTWAEATQDWIERKQDHSYREVLVRPAIRKALLDIDIVTGVIADMGCGDGSETRYLAEEVLCAKKHQDSLEWPEGSNVPLPQLTCFGYDPNEQFIDTAKSMQKGGSSQVAYSFHAGNMDDFLCQTTLKEKCDLVTSLFVLQDIPDYKRHIALLEKLIRPGGIALAVLVHPMFGRAMLEKGCIDYVGDDGPTFYGKYPIVEEGSKPFYVPYFHRPLEIYTYEFRDKFIFERVSGLQPNRTQTVKCVSEKISPFYPHEHNMYWPEIIAIPSSVLIKARRKW